MVLQEICSQQPVVIANFNQGFRHSERFSMAPTVAYEFGEINGDIRPPRHRAGFFGNTIERHSELPEGVEKGFRGFQVCRLKPFGEPVVYPLQKRQRIGGTSLIPP